MSQVEENVVKSWKPNSKAQETFLSLPGSVKEGFYGGAAFGGKSTILLHYPIAKGWYKHPLFHGALVRRTYKQLEETFILEGKQLYEKLFGAKWNATEKSFTFPSGAVIRCLYIDSKEDAEQHDSAQFNYIGWDELTHHAEWEYLYMLSRVRSRTPDLPAVMRAASNPLNIGHNWVKARFVTPYKDGYKILNYKLPNGETSKAIFIPAKATDNKDGLRANPDYLNQLMLLPEADKRAKLYGDWDAVAGQVFPEFRDRHFGDEPAEACHVIDDFIPEQWWPKILSLDWGYDHDFAFHAHTVSPQGQVITYKELVGRKMTPQVVGAEICRLVQLDGNIKTRIIDPSTNRSTAGEKSVKLQIEEATGWIWEDADNDRVSGRILMHEYLRWTPRPPRFIPQEGFSEEKYLNIWKFHGEVAAKRYAKLFVPDNPEAEPRPKWLITRSCKKIQETLPILVFNEKKPDDVLKVDGDDTYDGCRYGLKAVDRYINESKREFEAHQKVGEIVNELAKTGDQNRYYQRMAHLEATTKSKVVPIYFNKRHRNRAAVLSSVRRARVY